MGKYEVQITRYQHATVTVDAQDEGQALIEARRLAETLPEEEWEQGSEANCEVEALPEELPPTAEDKLEAMIRGAVEEVNHLAASLKGLENDLNRGTGNLAYNRGQWRERWEAARYNLDRLLSQAQEIEK